MSPQLKSYFHHHIYIVYGLACLHGHHLHWKVGQLSESDALRNDGEPDGDPGNQVGKVVFRAERGVVVGVVFACVDSVGRRRGRRRALFLHAVERDLGERAP